MRRTVVLSAAVAFLLLFAQTLATLHVYAHLDEPSTSSSLSDKQLPHSAVCDQCLAAAALGAGAPAAALVFAVTAADLWIVSHTTASFRSGPIPAYTSRAPPRYV